MNRELNGDEIKQIQLQLLLEFSRFCDENGLRYRLCGGTLLGAIRHKGFIPWDDDIDVLMPRPDYDTLLNWKGSADLPDYMELCSWKNRKIPYPYLKLADKRVSVQEKAVNVKYQGNVWIDIFPIDGNPEDEEENRSLYQKSLRLRKLFWIHLVPLGNGTTFSKKLWKLLIKPFLMCVGDYRICRGMDRLARSYDFESSSYIGGVLWGYGPQERLDKEGFLNAVEVEFEGHKFHAPSNYQEYLTNLYGDYMKLPPEEKRVRHGFTAWWES